MTIAERPTSELNLTVSGISVQVVRKAIKHIHVGVYPPDGRVRLAVPLLTSDDAARLAVVARLAWIKRHQRNFQEQPRQSQREMVNGESHYLFGHRYLLEVAERIGAPEIAISPPDRLSLSIHPRTSANGRRAALDSWYRQQISQRLPYLVAKWEDRLGVKLAHWGVKRMKTKWGSCNIQARRIWLNTELAKAPAECLDYVVLHEMVHLLERNHTERFKAILTEKMPNWQSLRTRLNSTLLGEISNNH